MYACWTARTTTTASYFDSSSRTLEKAAMMTASNEFVSFYQLYPSIAVIIVITFFAGLVTTFTTLLATILWGWTRFRRRLRHHVWHTPATPCEPTLLKAADYFTILRARQHRRVPRMARRPLPRRPGQSSVSPPSSPFHWASRRERRTTLPQAAGHRLSVVPEKSSPHHHYENVEMTPPVPLTAPGQRSPNVQVTSL